MYIKLSLPSKLLLSIIAAYIGALYLNANIISFAYTISTSLKDILLIALPLIIFSCISNSILLISKEDRLFSTLSSLLACVILSNYLSTIISYVSFNAMLTNTTAKAAIVSTVASTSSNIEALFKLPIPKLIANEQALLLGALIGIIASRTTSAFLRVAINKTYNLSFKFLNYIFLPILPIFIFGFLLKLFFEGTAIEVIMNSSSYIISGIIILITYLFLLTVIASEFKKDKLLSIIRNILPPATTAFSSMSSAAALPLSIEASIRNTNNKKLPQLFIPTTVNIHLIGDSILVPIMAFLLAYTYGIPLLEPLDFLQFATYFVLYKFAIAAVPGGGIIVMIPLLEKYLQFNSEMSGLITALYILLDPVITSANVFGNNVFCIIYNKLTTAKQKSQYS